MERKDEREGEGRWRERIKDEREGEGRWRERMRGQEKGERVKG
jgi:hypothetical protein